MKPEQPSPDVVALLAAVALVAAICVAWLCWRASFPLEIDGNEAWNAWHADDAFAPSRLYPPADALTNNNYPPLSFLILKSVAPLFANAIAAGRALSVLAILLTGGMAFLCARCLGAARTAAALGGAWLVATLSLGFSGYAGMNDPNLLGLAISTTGFALFLGARGPFAVYSAFAIMAVAGLVKHNLVATPLTAFLCLAALRRSQATLVLLFALALCVVMLGAARAVYGPNLLSQILAPRQISPVRPWESLSHLQGIAPVWPFFLLSLRYAASGHKSGPVWMLGGTGLLSWMVWKMGAGVDENVQFELVFATALAVALTLNNLGAARVPRLLFATVLAARLLTLPSPALSSGLRASIIAPTSWPGPKSPTGRLRASARCRGRWPARCRTSATSRAKPSSSMISRWSSDCC